MGAYEYIGQLYKQGSSKLELVNFCATAKDIKSWGGVPAKTERFHGGFQRALSERYKKITRYFDDGQCSPTSIVVAFRQGALKVSELAYPSTSWPSEEILSEKPTFVHLALNVDIEDEDDIALSELRKRVSEFLAPRLHIGETSGLGDTADTEASENDDDESTDESDEVLQSDGVLDVPIEASDAEVLEDADGSDAELDVGHSKLRAFYDFITDEKKIEQWLNDANVKYAQISAKVKKTPKENDFLEYSPEQRLRYSLVSLLRPAMIVDGQHRVWGAYNSKSAGDIKFTVCAIKDTDWIEQVFQFVVLNKLAHPISPGFLTSLLNTSLTNSEVSEIEERFDVIGIKNVDRKIIKYLNHNEVSPFYQMVSEPSELQGVDNEGKLSDKGMIRLAKRWIGVTRAKKELEMFVPALGVPSISAARKKWEKDEAWIEYFFAFWTLLKNKYQEGGVWEKKTGHLLYIVTMSAMQDLFLRKKSGGDAEFKNLEDFKAQVAKFFDRVLPTFFMDWQLTGLQSGDGPDWIKKGIEALRDGQSLQAVRDTSELFQTQKKKN
ncbi:hypothetical protein [Paraburkholderia sp. Cpub6]|uniref:hypothetical protein n=1 Tax=Paraburkholderia sp. Cpub6 TaxID=2723094 RepID=UPI0016075C03|nr:hypothetical protein [Paraburkholderia sp. Cpub6]MBB5458762.1 hypothetical protein [Paraburkholderia sp. Cpub6]